MRRATGLLVLLLATIARADLTAGDLLLLTNRNDPASAELARHYAEVRHVPAERVLSLDVPSGEQITPDVYDKAIAAPIREYLATPAGQGVRCLVLFYGLPLRVSDRPTSETDAKEAAALRALIAGLNNAAGGLTGDFHQIGESAGVELPAFGGLGVAAARVYVAEAERAIDAALRQRPDPARQQAVQQGVRDAQRKSIEAAVAALRTAFPGDAPAALPDADAVKLAAGRPRDPASRASVRQYVARTAGLFALDQIAGQHLAWCDNTESTASVDSELALVRVPEYPHFRWQPNPLNFRTTVAGAPVLMTCRIDAPTAEIARRLIDDSLVVEQGGLDGKVVFDARGIAAVKDGRVDPYGQYDQLLRNAGNFIGSKTNLELVTDDREAILSPHSVSGVADYCGWYSLRQYFPSCGFVKGAVGYHVASFELISLHDRFEKGWVANLLKDGIVATLGPVAEPYLQSFPRPDEFFPLLLTGRLTLAEVYWKTTPMTSWMQTLIGDPLYRPYARHPAVRPEDLPPDLRAALPPAQATTQNDR